MPEQDQPDLRAFWGKAGRAREGEEVVPHPLICHIIDTAAVAEILYSTLLGPACRAQLAAAFAPLGGDPRTWVALLCGLHDLGKLSPAFQAVRADLAVKLLLGTTAAKEVARLADKRRLGGRTDTFHGILTTLHIRRSLRRWGAPRETARALSQLLGGHHGSFFSDTSVQNADAALYDNGGERWAKFVEAMVRRTAELLGLPDPGSQPWSEVEINTTAAVTLAALTTVSDWIASASVDKSTYAGVDVDMITYLDLARERAREQVVDRLGWSGWSPPEDISFLRLFEQEPRPLQVAIEQMIGSKNRPGILVIDAPTGEGKTWIALHCVVSLMRQLGLIGFFVAMPTCATSNQMLDETEPVLERLDSPLFLKLLHGSAAYYLAGRRARSARAEPVRPEDVGADGATGPEDEAVGEWFTRARSLLAAAAVGTIDRILQAGIRSAWASVPMVGLSNRVLVLDEVHGYDVYMSTILDRVLWWLGSLGVPVILLSATLPTYRRKQLVHSWYAGATGRHPHKVDLALPAKGYPRALWVDEQGVPETVDTRASTMNADRRVALTRLDDHEVVGWPLLHAARGWGVAIIHNLVRRATVTAAALRDAVEALPEEERPRIGEITGRLLAKARAGIEAELKSRFGRGGERAPATGYIAVGTQVLEQSLDLDFDIMASDLAPIDGLIQRAGRLHRFRRTERESPPTLAIVGVTEAKAGPEWPPHTTNVYQDLALLRTWALLRDRTELALPGDIPALVEEVYPDLDPADESPAGWEKRWAKAVAAMRKEQSDDEARAKNLYLPPPTAENAVLEMTERPRPTSQTRKRGRRGGRDVR
jgi:CRISPR-associated endonuclease/helicase Cas3